MKRRLAGPIAAIAVLAAFAAPPAMAAGPTVEREVTQEYVPDDPRIATERYARTEIYGVDGSITIKGLGVRLYRKGEGTIIRAAGWVRFDEDGVVGHGPHDFLETDPADVYC
jgi:hypothetical protein